MAYEASKLRPSFGHCVQGGKEKRDNCDCQHCKQSIGNTVPIDRLNESYRQRALVIVKLAHLAQRLKYEVYRKEPKDGEWGILYIELPESQVSWHFSDKDAHMIEQFPIDNRDRWNGKYNGRDEQVMLNQF